MTPISEDRNGDPIFAGDTVIDIDGDDYVVLYGKFRDMYGFGYVYGYFIPDGCTKKST